MANDKHEPRWHSIGASVRGASHERSGLPNQDAIGWWLKAATGPPLILAVSDGHGSARSFRSDVGAQLAVSTAIQVLQDLPEEQCDVSLSAVKRLAEEQLPKALAWAWTKAVDDHIQSNPFSPEEEDILKKNSRLAYGATLLAVVIAESYILYLQLGDGDILAVSETGESFRPLPGDERLFANETTSLCSPNAWRDFRVHFQALAGVPPALILLSTDGYANSFRDEASFLQVGGDLLEIIRSDGMEVVNKSLETWLAEASRSGSGDDVTLGIICRTDALGEGRDGISPQKPLPPEPLGREPLPGKGAASLLIPAISFGLALAILLVKRYRWREHNEPTL